MNRNLVVGPSSKCISQRDFIQMLMQNTTAFSEQRYCWCYIWYIIHNAFPLFKAILIRQDPKTNGDLLLEDGDFIYCNSLSYGDPKKEHH